MFSIVKCLLFCVYADDWLVTLDMYAWQNLLFHDYVSAENDKKISEINSDNTWRNW